MAFNPRGIEALSELLKPPGDDDSSSDVRNKYYCLNLMSHKKRQRLDLLLLALHRMRITRRKNLQL